MLPTLSQKPGHILFVVGEYPPMVGGVGAYTAALGAAFVARGWQVSVVTSMEAQASPTGESTEDLPTSHPAITVYPIMARWGWTLVSKVARLAKEVGATLIHVQYQTGSFNRHPAINLAPLWWRRRGIPVVWTFHDLQCPRLRHRLHKVACWIRDLSARTCDWVITTNEGDSHFLKTLTSRLEIIPIGSNVRGQHFSPEERRARRALRGFEDEHLVVGYFGFVNQSKGVLDLLRVVERLRHEDRSVRLLMIGQLTRLTSGWEMGYVKEVQDYIHDQGLAELITSTGYQADAEISADLASCDVVGFLYQDGASTRRGTLLAGLAQGCAIVTTTPKFAFPGVVDGRDLLFVPVGDVEATLAAVRRIADDPAFKESLRQNALAVSETFSWETIAAAHERFYLRAE